MKYLAKAVILGSMLLMLLAACGPATAFNPQLVPTSIKNQVIFPQLLKPKPLVCTPEQPTIDQVTSYCSNAIKGIGGASFVSHPKITSISVMVPNYAPCKFTNGTFVCTGAPNTQYQYVSCTFCGAYTAPEGTQYVCASGYQEDAVGNCNLIDPNADYLLCPAGSHYVNAVQDCVSDATGKVASVCPADHPNYTPYDHVCYKKAEMAFNCQTFPIPLGACPFTKPPAALVNVVPFCQNSGANKGGANISFPAGSSLKVDIKANRLDGCTPDGAQPDGTQRFTCWGAAGQTFNYQVCSDPATCTAYKDSLGACSVKNDTGPTPAPPIHG